MDLPPIEQLRVESHATHRLPEAFQALENTDIFGAMVWPLVLE